MKGREEHEQKSIAKMQELLKDKPDYVRGFYNSLDAKSYLTAQDYTLTVLRFLRAYNVDEFTEDNINSYLRSLKGREGKCSDSFRENTRYALNLFGEYLTRNKYIQTNPVKAVGKKTVNDNPKKVSMSSEELRFILDRIENNDIGTPREQSRRELWVERNYAIFSLLITTGMRVNALVEINLEDYNPDTGKLSITEKRNKTFDYDLEEETVKAINNWLIVRKRLLKKEECDALFISNRRKRMTTKSIRDLVAIYTSGLEKHITPHKFRSSFITLIYKTTGDIYYAKQVARHSQISSTERYIDVEDVSKDAGTTIRKAISL